MPTTSKMGISYPSSSDLVKDGATNMGTIATTVDSKTGLILINTTTFNAVSSQSINNIFSATFDNYRILIDLTGSTTNATGFRLRVSGTDSTANYSRQYIYGDGSSLSAGRVTGTSEWGAIDVTSSTRGAVAYDIYNPFLTKQTLMFGVNASRYASSTYLAINGYGHDASTSYDGITLTASTGTITGSVEVYGYNQ